MPLHKLFSPRDVPYMGLVNYYDWKLHFPFKSLYIFSSSHPFWGLSQYASPMQCTLQGRLYQRYAPSGSNMGSLFSNYALNFALINVLSHTDNRQVIQSLSIHKNLKLQKSITRFINKKLLDILDPLEHYLEGYPHNIFVYNDQNKLKTYLEVLSW